ncbi:MAG: ATP synthase F1 subunit gamma [Firmicutes bacterium]|nr:ATP synthase F1 subunit gamma [Bacillota bacterium]
MAGGQERVLRRRIRSIESTKKITRAFELIAQSQIARAQARIAGTREYSEGLQQSLAICASQTSSALLGSVSMSAERQAILIAIAGDRGLCGGYNTLCLRSAEKRLAQLQQEGFNVKLITVGKKAENYFKYRHIDIEAAFSKMSNRPTFEDARTISHFLVGLINGNLDVAMEIIGWRFYSVASQKLASAKLLPLKDARAQDGEYFGEDKPAHAGNGASYFFEPEPESLLQILLPIYLEADIFRALLEASASEHTARQRAMAAATQNAEDLITVLRRKMNRVRQEAITTEIMEIVGGAEALRSLGTAEDRGQPDLEIIRPRG